MPLPSLDEIKDRKIVRWAVAYLAGAWLVLQVLNLVGDRFGWPDAFFRGLIVVSAVGFAAALVLAWYHGEQGAQKVSRVEAGLLTGLLLLAGIGVAAVGGGTPAEPMAEGAVPAVLAEPDFDQTTLAVLPFETIGADSAGYLADGLTEELLATFARVPSLRVAARTSAFAFKGADVPADSVGRALNVAHLVEGTVRHAAGRVRVAAQLVDTKTGLQEWAGTYDREVADVFAVQEEIARAVAYELRTRIGAKALTRGTEDPEAYALVLRAREAPKTGDRQFDYAAEERLYEEALALDSTYAAAWAGLAIVRQQRAQLRLVDDWEAEYERARAAARRAVALDPDQGRAHLALGAVAEERDGNLGAAQAHLERAVAANPSDAAALARLGFVLGLLGNEAGAVRAAERAVALDPLSPDVLQAAAFVYTGTERAIELLRALVALAPDNVNFISSLANELALAGDTDEALALLGRVRERDPDYIALDIYEAYAFARAGRRADAERALAAIPEGGPVNLIRAAVEMGLGDRDAAFAALDRAVAEREPLIEQIPTDPWFLPLHGDPRWRRFEAPIDVRGPRDG